MSQALWGTLAQAAAAGGAGGLLGGGTAVGRQRASICGWDPSRGQSRHPHLGLSDRSHTDLGSRALPGLLPLPLPGPAFPPLLPGATSGGPLPLRQADRKDRGWGSGRRCALLLAEPSWAGALTSLSLRVPICKEEGELAPVW